MKIFILSTILLIIAVIGISIKLFIKKGSEFKHRCSSQDPHSNHDSCVCEHNNIATCKNKKTDDK